jgi:hypothetical protein
VEHAALYKLAPQFKSMVWERDMNNRRNAVYQSLTAFEDEFERKISEMDA